jgi:fido (protein-threonine AMPylation protein)
MTRPQGGGRRRGGRGRQPQRQRAAVAAPPDPNQTVHATSSPAANGERRVEYVGVFPRWHRFPSLPIPDTLTDIPTLLSSTNANVARNCSIKVDLIPVFDKGGRNDPLGCWATDGKHAAWIMLLDIPLIHTMRNIMGSDHLGLKCAIQSYMISDFSHNVPATTQHLRPPPCLFVLRGYMLEAGRSLYPRPAPSLLPPPPLISHGQRATDQSDASDNRWTAGRAATVYAAIFSRLVHGLSVQDLAGVQGWQRLLSQEDFGVVTQFLPRHQATCALHQTSAPDGNTVPFTGHYMAALRDFAQGQHDRQKASLTSNTGRTDAAQAAKVATQYLQALALAQDQAAQADGEDTLTPARLLAWHALVCGDGVHATAGTFRTTGVRCGTTHFGSSRTVPETVDALCQTLQQLQESLCKMKNQSNGAAVSSENGAATAAASLDDRADAASQRLWAALVYAAAVLFGVLDTHPFADGNGRTARIACNWALQHTLDLPFSVLLFATPGQRREYQVAVLQTRTNLYLSRHDVESARDSNGHDFLQSLQDQALAVVGLFEPLVHLLLNRLSRTISEFNKVLDERCQRASEEMAASMARKHREEAAKGTCIICFEDGPNIATLCCGKAVHLNCVAEWLASNTSCPTCRATMPTLSPRLQSAPSSPFESTADSDEDPGTFETTESDDDDDSDGTTQTTDEEDDVDATTADTDPAPGPPRCLECSNIAATECSNKMCGRCCVLCGNFACARHNSYSPL